MATITILDETYTLPAVSTTRFQALQAQVRTQPQVIQTGLRPQAPRWGFLPRAPQTLTPEERWQELELLVRNYDPTREQARQNQSHGTPDGAMHRLMEVQGQFPEVLPDALRS